MNDLQEFLTAKASELGVPGATAGVIVDGKEITAFHGVTSVENPLDVDERTLFQFGSTGKTFTATAVMRLVEQGKLDLDAPVRTYVPELRLKDEDAARDVTVLQLLNHVAGWEGDSLHDTGDGDDCLEKFVEHMATLQQVTPLGTTVSYNNASLSLAGHVIARVTGTTYEQAVKDLLLDPLGLDMTFFKQNDIMTRRFVVGHEQKDDGTVAVARPWGLPRSGAPAGGMSATVGDQLAWARFHLGDGTAPDGTRLLTKETLTRMQQPTQETPGSALGDGIGISWLLKDVDGTPMVSHGGTTHGQYSDFHLVPSRGFAVTCLSNCGPNGSQLNHAVTQWALEHYLGLKEAELVTAERSEDELAEFTGSFETIAVTVEISAVRGGLDCLIAPKPEMLRAMRESGEEAPEQPPLHIGLVEGADTYVVTEGPAKGMRGFFTRDASGRIDGVHLGGRLASRVAVNA